VKCLFFCPVYNEREAFPAVLDGLRRQLPSCDVLLVENGSNDGSEALVRDSGLPFLRIEHNRGLGHAFIRALDWALERDYAVFGAIAANGKMLPDQIPRLLEPLLEDRSDCVSGSRFLPGGDSSNLPAFRRRTIPWVTRLAGGLVGQRLTDGTCGFRAYRTEPLRRAGFDWHAPWLWEYGFEFYVYAKFLLDERLRCSEVPVTMRYPARRHGYSKVPPVVGWWSMLRPWFVARFDGKGFDRD